jgi:hypothetical protein
VPSMSKRIASLTMYRALQKGRSSGAPPIVPGCASPGGREESERTGAGAVPTFSANLDEGLGAAKVLFGKAWGSTSLIGLAGLSATDRFRIQGGAAGGRLPAMR